MLKVASWNVNSIKVRLTQVLDWLASEQPDLLALQEIKTIDDNFPRQELEDAGYQCLVNGQKTYNGVAILNRTRHEPAGVVDAIPGLEDPQRRVLAASYGDVRLVNLYVPNGSEVGSEKYRYKLQWLKQLHEWLAREIKQHEKMIVVGDFNIAPEDRDVHDPVAWQGSVLVSDEERIAFKALLAEGFCDSFRLFNEEGGNFSWWDYRAAAFRRNLGLRIDHILISQSLRETCSSCIIDTVPRGWERPSDHAPVLARFEEA